MNSSLSSGWLATTGRSWDWISRSSIRTQFPIPHKLEDLAAQVATTIRALQPQGPYYVGGWCRFGPLAYETARHMITRGEEVAR